MRLIEELKRRNVFRVGAAYVLLGWLIIQVTDTVAEPLQLPGWTLAFVTWVGIIGLPFALFFAWAYELTPDGIKREEDVDRSESVTRSTGRKLDIALVGMLVLAVGFIGWDALTRSSDQAPRIAATAGTGHSVEQSIAVLPLTNMSAVSENAFFAGGVHEEILTNLSRIEGLRVVSRTTALRYISSDLGLRDIGRELGVRYIVEGSVRRINNHVRITVQLIDAVEDAHLWASNYDRELVDVFATQSEVAREITNSLHLEIQPETVGSLDDMPTRSVKAYDQFLKAKSIDRSEYQTEDALRRQRKLLEAAVAEDPGFVEAWGYLNEMLDETARTIVQNQWFGTTDEERDAAFAEVRAAAKRALDRAVALDPDNIETLMAQASDFVREQQDPEYRRDRRQYIDRALEISPDDAHAWYVLAWWYRIEGQMDLATEHFRKSLELDPLHARVVTGSLLHFRSVGDQAMTTKLFERLAQIAPEKGDDRSLGLVSPSVRLSNLIALFGETADTAVIDTFAEELAASSGTFEGGDGEEILYALQLRELRNDLDGVTEMIIGFAPDETNYAEVINFLFMMDALLAGQVIAGKTVDAESTARRIVELEYAFRLDDGLSPFFFERMQLRADVLLGNIRTMDELRRHILASDEEESFENTPLWPSLARAHIDRDQVVAQILEMKARYPNWFGTDVTAISHITQRHIITHPDMQAFYVQEGKWIDYLAERVPEYAKYRR